MATIPNKIEKFRTVEIDPFSTISQATWQKAAGLMSYINAALPIGIIVYVRTTQDNLPELPEPKYWQYCDGSPVTNTLSPMFGQNVPDHRERFIKHPSDTETDLSTGGVDSKTFPHDHGGVTGSGNPRGPFNADNNDNFSGPFIHTHPIASASPSSDIKPSYRDLKAYIRIV